MRFKTIAMLFAVLAFSCALNASEFFPFSEGFFWKYKVDYKDPGKQDIITGAYMKPDAHMYGRFYYKIELPEASVFFRLREDETGLYVSDAKYPFELFGIPVNVALDPEVRLLKFPVVIGESWEHKGKAKANFLAFMNVEKDIRIKYTYRAYENINVGAESIRCLVLDVDLDMGDGKPVKQVFYYGEGIGYLMGDEKSFNVSLLEYKKPEQIPVMDIKR